MTFFPYYFHIIFIFFYKQIPNRTTLQNTGCMPVLIVKKCLDLRKISIFGQPPSWYLVVGTFSIDTA